MTEESSHPQSNGHVHAEHVVPVSDWSADDVATWLQENGFQQYVDLITITHRIDGSALLQIREADLRRPPLSMAVLGDIKRLAICIQKLKVCPEVRRQKRHTVGVDDEDENLSDLSSDTEDSGSQIPSATAVQHRRPRMSRHLNADFTKLAVSYIYMFVVFMLTAFVMVVVHDRVPDMDRYPPLPDIVLDNLPYIPWAFDLCELTAVSMSLALIVILFIHKHRFIIMRRIFALTGTVFMLRCITMLITSLSVPGIHLQCQPKVYGTLWSKLERALAIWTGFGMSLKGVRSCDTPRRVPMLHTVCWILNIFAVFFILAAHEHYSIDVFIAFYITSRLFLYYHSLASSRVLRQPDSGRTRTWFPLFSYFESSIDGVVPNEYEWPLPSTAAIQQWFRNLRAKKQQ